MTAGPRRQRAFRHLMIVHNQWPDPRVEREARALVANGIQVDVICARDAYDSPDSGPGIEVQRLPVWRRRGRGAGLQMLEYLAFLFLATVHATLRHARRRYRTVQVHNPPDFLVFAALLPKLTGAKVIIDLHDLMPEFYASRFGTSLSALPVRLMARQEKVAAGFADRVITVTERWRRTLEERGVPSAKLSVLMNLPDPAIYGREVAATRREGTPFTIIYHGTLNERYGLDILLRAVALARRDLPFHLIVHGHGALVETLPTLAAELGVDDIVEFSTRRLPAEELPTLLRRADMAVVPYRRDVFTDGILPTKLMEYTALGIPTIVTRTPVIEEYFDDSMVRFVPAEDEAALAAAIVELGRDPDQRAEIARNAARFMDRHAWQRNSAEYVAMVRELAGQAPS